MGISGWTGGTWSHASASAPAATTMQTNPNTAIAPPCRQTLVTAQPTSKRWPSGLWLLESFFSLGSLFLRFPKKSVCPYSTSNLYSKLSRYAGPTGVERQIWWEVHTTTQFGCSSLGYKCLALVPEDSLTARPSPFPLPSVTPTSYILWAANLSSRWEDGKEI